MFLLSTSQEIRPSTALPVCERSPLAMTVVVQLILEAFAKFSRITVHVNGS
jgi:hypothetical protein